ncbi:YbcC family protein [Aestuariivirga sp.]|uniref:YbcC family protein n=1 Tax=Aestuariivirga sp. TaxID=2650926 RepID=UPI00391B206C
MNMHVSASAVAASAMPAEPSLEEVARSASAACARIAPLWPLRSFVAVNPFMGLAGFDAFDAADVLARAGNARLTMPASHYEEALEAGEITDADLAHVLARHGRAEGLPRDATALAAALRQASGPESGILPTVADTARALTGKDWPALVTDRISHWASHHFDLGQCLWSSPTQDLPPYAAWRKEAVLDLTPEVMGLNGFRRAIAGLPADPEAAMARCVAALGLAPETLADYFHRLLFSLGGWASYGRQLGWKKELAGERDGTLAEFLAIRLAWEHGIARAIGEESLLPRWRQGVLEARAGSEEKRDALHLLILAHAAYEQARQRVMLAKFPAARPVPGARPRLQAVFCIDVRSEVFRRALEKRGEEIETVGFAGFFGAPLSYRPLGAAEPREQVPVLLKPALEVAEEAAGGAGETNRLAAAMGLRKKAAQVWASFKQGGVASFGFVETAGAGFGFKLVADSLGFSGRPAAAASPGCRPAVAGIALQDRIAMAEGALRGMSLTTGLARLVLLVGHGSSSINNLHASGLDCGACGGHTGEANARVMAAVLNDDAVRAALAERGIAIPQDTLFLGALHNTTTDEVTVFDADGLRGVAAQDLAWARAQLAGAGAAARAERSVRLGGSGDVARRGADWSQVRPEWGLAGCNAFIAAPRRFTAGADLEGRAFLHSYEWRQDQGFKVLELIMTAPLVVASWISLQYFGSTVDNDNFGCGNKVLHNAVGTFGVLEGNSGNLRSGLPLQSVHDGKRFVHDPVRLSVMIAAPREAMNGVIARHAHLRDLVDNGWLHLFAMDDDGSITHRYAGGLAWEALQTSA